MIDDKPRCVMLGCRRPAKHHKGLCDTPIARVLHHGCTPLVASKERKASA